MALSMADDSVSKWELSSVSTLFSTLKIRDSPGRKMRLRALLSLVKSLFCCKKDSVSGAYGISTVVWAGTLNIEVPGTASIVS